MPTLFIMNGILVRVVVSREAWWGSEEVVERADVNGRVKYWEMLSNR